MHAGAAAIARRRTPRRAIPLRADSSSSLSRCPYCSPFPARGATPERARLYWSDTAHRPYVSDVPAGKRISRWIPFTLKVAARPWRFLQIRPVTRSLSRPRRWAECGGPIMRRIRPTPDALINWRVSPMSARRSAGWSIVLRSRSRIPRGLTCTTRVEGTCTTKASARRWAGLTDTRRLEPPRTNTGGRIS